MNAQNAQWLILVLVNIPVFLGLGRIIFSDWNSFFEALRLWTSADWWFTLQKHWQLVWTILALLLRTAWAAQKMATRNLVLFTLVRCSVRR